MASIISSNGNAPEIRSNSVASVLKAGCTTSSGGIRRTDPYICQKVRTSGGSVGVGLSEHPWGRALGGRRPLRDSVAEETDQQREVIEAALSDKVRN